MTTKTAAEALEELRQKAMAVVEARKPEYSATSYSLRSSRLKTACTPEVILALLDELAQLRAHPPATEEGREITKLNDLLRRAEQALDEAGNIQADWQSIGDTKRDIEEHFYPGTYPNREKA